MDDTILVRSHVPLPDMPAGATGRVLRTGRWEGLIASGKVSVVEERAVGTVSEVLAWVGDDPDRAYDALEAELDGRGRVSLIGALERVVDG